MALLLLAPLTTLGIAAQTVLGVTHDPAVISTTLAFDDGKVVTVQYSQIYFCDNSFGQDTSTSSNPCIVGREAVGDPVNELAISTLNVIVPAFLPPLCTPLGITCLTGSDLAALGFTPGTGGNTVLDPTLGGNDLTQCPDNHVTVALTCPNHPDHLNLPSSLLGALGFGNIPLPIHSHIISGQGVTSGQGGWWKLNVWLVLDPSVWPNPSTGLCSAGTGCLTSDSALAAASSSQVVGPVSSTVYLFFNVVSASSK